MSDHRDPKVTTARAGTRRMRRWIAIGVGVIVVLILISLVFGGGREAPVVTDDPAATAPEATPTAPAGQ